MQNCQRRRYDAFLTFINLTASAVASEDDPSHRGSGVSLLYQDVASAVVDVLEAVRTQQDPSVPSGHNHQDVAHVQNLRGDKSERNVRPAWAGENTGRDAG